MLKFTVVLLSCLAFFQGYVACAEDYSECRQRCEGDFADCSNAPPAPESEVQEAIMASCDKRLQSCYAECENLKPVEEPPTGVDNNPNIIQK